MTQYTDYRVGAEPVQPTVDAHVGQYVACVYDTKWWNGYVLERSQEQEGVKVKLMHSKGPAISFEWPTT